MAIYGAIRQGLEAQLATVPNLPNWIGETTQFTPKVNAAYTRSYLMPATMTEAELGASGRKMCPGIFQVTLVYPATTGLNAIESMVDAILDAFDRSTNISSGGLNIFIKSVTRRQAQIDSTWYQVPVLISWWTLVPN